MLTLTVQFATIIPMQLNLDVELEGTNLKNQAAYREWKRQLQELPRAIVNEGMRVSLKAGATYLRNLLRSVIPRSEKLRNPQGRHLADTGRVTKGKIEYDPSFIVKYGNARARHYHLFTFGFQKRGGKGRYEGNQIMIDTTNRSLTDIDNIVAEETVRREPEIIREVRNPKVFNPRFQ